MGTSAASTIEPRQLRRRLQRKYLAKRLTRIRRRTYSNSSFIVDSLEVVGKPP